MRDAANDPIIEACATVADAVYREYEEHYRSLPEEQKNSISLGACATGMSTADHIAKRLRALKDDAGSTEKAIIASDWRPMSTAPKDGQELILCGDPKRYGRPVRIDFWDKAHGCWYREYGSPTSATYVGWLPLPAPRNMDGA